MKGDLTIKILEALESAASVTGELLGVFLCDYQESYRRARGKAYGRMYDKKSPTELKKERDKKFYNLMHRLRKDGLITKKKSSWAITKKGKQKLDGLKERKEVFIPRKKYLIEEGKELNIIIFDIPEEQRRKRDWLRETLIQLGFSKLQQSVWISKNKLPEELLKDLQTFHILEYVEIFSITKTGTIRHIGK